MANIGLRKPFVGKKTDTGYDTHATLGKAVSIEVTPNYATGALYGDDTKCEEDREFIDATVTLGTTTVPVKFNESMFGHALNVDETTYNAYDEVPYVGLGFIGVEKIDGVKKYVATFLPRVKFAEPGKSYETKGDSITYNTPSLEGSALALDNGDWKFDKICDTEADAITWIEGKFTA
ncbi:MAG: major tail protein [Eubacteriales bacterium]|nr:major tail protein [Eubacteriales bacterium]